MKQRIGRGGLTEASRGIHCYLRKYAEEFKTLIYIHDAFPGLQLLWRSHALKYLMAGSLTSAFRNML